MTDINNESPAAKEAESKKKVATLEDSVKSREIYADIGLALNRFTAIQAMPDATNLVALITGLTQQTDEAGNPVVNEDGSPAMMIDASKYPETHEVMIAKLTRVEKAEKPGESGKQVLVALLIHPIPKLEALVGTALAAEGTNSFVDGTREIMRKEMNFRAVRPLRKALTGAPEAPSLQSLTGEMPLSVAEFIEGSRSGGGIMESFDTIQREVLQLLVKQSKLFARAKLTKPEFRKALESAAYAQFHYAAIEERGRFMEVLNYMKAFAGQKGLNTDIFDTWINTRADQSYDPTVEDESEDSFDLMKQLADDSATTNTETTTA